MAQANRPYKSGTTVTFGNSTEDTVWNVLTETVTFLKTLTAAVTSFALRTLTPTLSGAFTVTRMAYMKLATPTLSGSAVLTDAAVFQFDAAAGTHKAVDAGSTKTSPGTVSAWIKHDINGTIYYCPAYTSKTS